jgi:hypothetical protein
MWEGRRQVQLSTTEDTEDTEAIPLEDQFLRVLSVLCGGERFGDKS